jgi:all-trans-retinol 13,14-reductase
MSDKAYARFSSEVDLSSFDHVVIGSGMGGLTVATWLAKAGHSVAVLERHYVPGGFTHCFKRKQGFQWDVGVHYVGNMEPGNDLRKFFDFITGHSLDWEPVGDVYDKVYIAGEAYEFKAGKEAFRAQMNSYFPAESVAIDAYLSLVEKVSKGSSSFFFEKTFKPWLSKSLGWFIRKRYARYSQRSTWDVLSELTQDERLIAVLCGQCGNYGLAPKESSFATHALIVNHFMEGAYYPKGGSEQIALKTMEHFTSLGGKVFIKAEVQEIITEKNKVKGIQVNGEFHACKSLISNVGVNNTFNGLLSAEARKISSFDLKKVKASTGHLCLYVGLDGTDEELDLPKHNVWHFESVDQGKSMSEINLKNTTEKFNYISFPSAKDPEWQAKNPGTSTIQALTAGHYKWFAAYDDLPWMKRSEVYEKIKLDFEKAMLERLYVLFPKIKGKVLVTEVSSPLSTKHFSNYQEGEIYGLAHSPARFTLPFLRFETPIKGLRLVGQDITVVGLASAMVSGVLCSTTILKFRVWKLFKEMNAGRKEISDF